MGLRYKKSSRSFKEQIIVMVIFVVGIILGSFFANKVYNLGSNQIIGVMDTIDEFVEVTASGGVSEISLFKRSFISYSKQVTIIWVLGFFSVAIPIIGLIIGAQGFSYGFTTTCFIIKYKAEGLIMSLGLYGVQGALLVSLLVIMSTYIMSMHRRNKRIKLKSYVICLLVSLLGIIMISMYESYIPQLQMQLIITKLNIS